MAMGSCCTIFQPAISEKDKKKEEKKLRKFLEAIGIKSDSSPTILNNSGPSTETAPLLSTRPKK